MSEELEKKIAELHSYIHELERDLIHDSLTSLKTRAFFEEEFKLYISLVSSATNSKRREWFGFKNISLLFFDIDFFKKINDTYGHDTGDVVLSTVAKTIDAEMREGDTVARWGGEEIAALLLGASEEDAKRKADDVRKKIESLVFSNLPDLKVTISCGVSSATDGLSYDEVLARADKALYQAKEMGRNKAIAFSELPE